MRQLLPAGIALRYMRSRHSHSAVRAITAVAVCGVAVATAAIICVLSVFNGFRDVIGIRLDRLSPDVMVTPARGKVFADADSLANIIKGVEGVKTVTVTLTDNALALYHGHEMPVTLKGVDFDAWRTLTAIDSIIVDGGDVPATSDYSPELAVNKAVFSIGAASRMGINPADMMVLLFAPKREGRVNLANPVSSFLTDSLYVSAIYQAEQSEYDNDYIVAPLPMVRELFQRYGNEGSAVEVSAREGVDATQLANKISSRLGKDTVVKDRMAQQDVNFRMVKIEKWVTFLLLFFILIIASFNIISTLCMAVIEKTRSMATLHALGFTRRQVGSVFWWESMYVTLVGGVSGLLLGCGLCLLQEKYGFIKLAGGPEGLITESYPVKLIPADVGATMIPVIITGIITAFIAAAFARQRLRVS